MKLIGKLLVLASLAATGAGIAGAQAYDPLPGPSPYGPDDEAGASNTQTAERAREAVKLVKTGKVYRLGHVYEEGMPAFPGNQGWHMTPNPVQTIAQQRGHTETLQGEIVQLGTQFDSLGHFGFLPAGASDPDGVLYYNQFTGAEVVGPDGLKRLGVEKVKPFVTRGVLLDVKRYANGGQTLTVGQEITVAMLEQTMAAQKVDIREGDVVLIVTGWEERWSMGTNGYYLTNGELGAPGLGLAGARWLADKGVACIGADNWGLEVAPPPPSPAPGVLFAVHHHLLIKSGVFMQESMVLSELAADLAADFQKSPNSKAYEFLYIFNPVPIKGASGSLGVPIAIR
ncbi:MAG TPA: cyclase family protein [Thermoanaerobaculia bacterium]|nr:cyclase family protein [Thermoanaerobaculia bacterium]